MHNLFRFKEYFVIFIVQRHPINCFVRRHGYVSNTSGQLVSIPVIFVFDEVG